ncbi:MAG: NlpC/P60 family protein [Syntrophorhabdus sp.]
MRRRLPLYTFCLITLFLVLPFVINAAQTTYKVKQGDSLKSISKKTGLSVNQLKSMNGLNSNKLSIGQNLVVKNDTDRPSRKEAKNRQSKKAMRGQIRADETPESVAYDSEGDYIEYKVKRGDTIDKIASLFNVEKNELIEANDLASRKKLSPGKTILIPKIVEEGNDDEMLVTLKSVPTKPWKNNDEKYMLVKVAKSFMGAPYKYGGNTLRGLDCSAYVKKIYEIFDVQLPRSAREQYHAGTKINRNELAVGDLVFFKTRRYAKYPTHVGIFIGDGNFIHASSGKGRLGVKIDSLGSDFYSSAFIGATRVKGNAENVQGSGNTQTADKTNNNS